MAQSTRMLGLCGRGKERESGGSMFEVNWIEGRRQLELQGPSSGLGHWLGSVSAIVVHVRFSRSRDPHTCLLNRSMGETCEGQSHHVVGQGMLGGYLQQGGD